MPFTCCVDGYPAYQQEEAPAAVATVSRDTSSSNRPVWLATYDPALAAQDGWIQPLWLLTAARAEAAACPLDALPSATRAESVCAGWLGNAAGEIEPRDYGIRLGDALGGDPMPDGATVLVFGDVGPHPSGDIGTEGGTLGGVDLADVCNTLCSVWEGRHEKAIGNTHRGVTSPDRELLLKDARDMTSHSGLNAACSDASCSISAYSASF